MDEFVGFSLFNDINNDILQAYNRLQMMKNINKMHGSVLSRKYGANFSKKDIMKMTTIASYIDRYGEEEVKKMVGLTV